MLIRIGALLDKTTFKGEILLARGDHCIERAKLNNYGLHSVEKWCWGVEGVWVGWETV